MNNQKIAEVLPLKLNLNHGFYYLIPEHLKGEVEAGKRVIIPFRNKKKVGIILTVSTETEFRDLKEIEEVLDPVPLLSKEVLALTSWIADYYLCPRGTIISLIAPTQIFTKKIAALVERNSLIKPVMPKRLTGSNDSAEPILFQYRSFKERDLYYLHLIENTIEQDRQVLILIPDQFSAGGLKKRLTKIYGKSLAFFDKKVSTTQKYLRFLSVQQDDLKVVIGTRSSIFLPFGRLGLIIVEREESPLYKEERAPHYHAREVALARGLAEPCQVILGSPAPSLESYWQSSKKNYSLKTREDHNDTVQKSFLTTYVVDLEKEKSFQRVISYQLQELISRNLQEKKGIVLFLNRRGFAGYIFCAHCGQVLKCTHCNSLLSYIKEGNKRFILCPKCGEKVPENRLCPRCGEKALKPMGFGTQYVADIVRRMFPKAVVQCFDSDIAPNLRIQQQLLNRFKKREIDILIGTQLLSGKLDYQKVELMGFILIDHLLNIPDYRSAEITFQLMYQIALNLEEQKKPKTLLIQTCQPEHHSLQAIKKLNYPLFYQQEIELRKELEYPPFTRMIKVDFIGSGRESVKKEAQEFREFIGQSGIGPMVGRHIFLSEDNRIRTDQKGDNQLGFLLKILEKNHNFEKVRQILFPYILKYPKNKVKLMVNVEPLKLF
ncbi:MAG TPA: primosomal protein N' [Atribacterota bacterium]|nr:primosomal protein N' [Atribacterota bacterium]